jgi:3-oxoacyl-[acyl-carrier protein] reductase
MDLSRLAPPRDSRLVVRGGCGGIGRALVRAALENGLRVAVLDLPRSLDEHPPPAGVETWPIDATVEAEVLRSFGSLEARWGGFDHLVNLAGFTTDVQPLDALALDDWNEVLEGSLRTTFLACRAAVPLIRRAGGGSIVNMASGLAWNGRPGYSAYAAAKGAVVALTRTLATETAPEIRVNAVAPGAVATAFLSGGTGRGGSEEAAPRRLDLEDYVRRVPLRRVAVPEDIVGPILFLTSEAAAYITGQVLHLNGGSFTP